MEEGRAQGNEKGFGLGVSTETMYAGCYTAAAAANSALFMSAELAWLASRCGHQRNGADWFPK